MATTTYAQSFLLPRDMTSPVIATKKIDRTHNSQITFAQYVQANKLDLSHGSVKDTDIPGIVEFLKKHPNVTVLDLSWNSDLTTAGLVQLAAIDTLTDLDISRNGKPADTTNYGLEAKDVAPFANHPSLKRLNLAWNNIGNEGAVALAKNTVLETLDVSVNDITDVGAIALAKNKVLKELLLRSNWNISLKTAEAFAANSTLNKLDLRQTNMTDETAVALAKNTHLTELDVSVSAIGDVGAIALAKNQTLRKLDLCEDPIGLEGAKALAANKTLTDLTLCGDFMSSKGPRFGDEGAAAFRDNTSLQSLGIMVEKVTAKGVAELAKNHNIKTLWLSGNKIGYDGVMSLAKNANQYTELGLAGCKLTDKEAQVLAGMNLKILYLVSNSISDAGAGALSNNNTLEKLNLMINEIHDEGAMSLAQTQTLSHLNVFYNPIGELGWVALKNNPKISLD